MHHADNNGDPTRRISPLGWVAILGGVACLTALIWASLAKGEGTIHMEAAPGTPPPLWQFGIPPFIAILGAIAFLPLIPATQRWWESNMHRLFVSLLCASGTLVYTAYALGVDEIVHLLEHAIIREYLPFIVLLFSLYVVSGGIHLRGELSGRPRTNAMFLITGGLLASFIGTTGASMLLIRPLLQMNRGRRYVVHTVVFFIFVVSNIGGTLLPIGDPPLFLGYLHGVDFFWSLGLWPQWGFCCAILITLYYLWDRRLYARESEEARGAASSNSGRLRVEGWHNAFFLMGIVLAVALVNPDRPLIGTDWHPFPFLREILMLGMVAAGLVTTRPEIRVANRFNYHAILEVGALFIGIFITMQIPLRVLKALGPAITQDVNQPWQFFWITGSISSVLDNAPTYVVFFELAKTASTEPEEAIYVLNNGGTLPLSLLVAISLGAVFMGAMTYVGNGPNFMVKSIAEQAGVRMPSFFGYLFRFSIPILVPLFVLVTILFLQ